ncbi:RNA-directed DNA polymerase, eukaryota, reverse transcriptase zinc-binding domain protein [Tanacetum coccineum]
MDNIIAQVCQTGRGRADFARVLVEFDVTKGFKKEICIQYMSKENIVKGTKVVNVEYQWRPEIYSHCYNQKKGESRYFENKGRNTNGVYKRKEVVKEVQNDQQKDKTDKSNDVHSKEAKGSRSKTIQDDILSPILKSNNKYVVLEEEETDERTKLKSLKYRMLVDHFVYAANCGIDRRRLWNELRSAANVIDCANDIKMEDINSIGLFYTWIKSPSKSETSIMKKLDKIMVNGIFMSTFAEAYGHFLPFITSDHSVALLIIPRSLIKKRRSFRVVKKLKAIKQPMRKLNWKNGNLTEKVEVCMEELKASQRDMAENPHNERLMKLSVIASKRNINRIMSICNENGERFKGNLVAEQFVNHFKKLLGPNKRGADMNTQNLFTTKLSDDEANKMVVDVSDKEIKEAMFDISENKASGHDGKLLGEINATLITLLPKISQPNKSAFVPGRAIQDNLMITQEPLKGYNCKNSPSRCSLKIDIAKAYDIVDWNFWQATLENFSFHSRMVCWIMTCVSSAAFTIGINGEINGYFKSSRGLIQGDPVSPYPLLFYRKYSHIELLARKVKENSISVIKEALMEFSNSSSLKPNMDKSVVFFRSVKEMVKQRILEVLPFKVGKLHVKYLGILLLPKKLGINDYKQLVEKVKNRIED